MQNLRNFCTIAHIDHGKSTLADRLLEVTKTVVARDMRAQLLDDMDLEREKGITIKSRAIQMSYTHRGTVYQLNLIDTPGHVDFSYEVSRSIAACEGALLVVDATQGVEAQTMANLHLALKQRLVILPIVNKIDLPHAQTQRVTEQLVDILGCTPGEIIRVSAKEGLGITALLEAIITRIPAPTGCADTLLRAMVFDAVYNPFRGIEVYFRIFDGTLHRGDLIRFLQTQKNYHADEIGILKLEQVPQATLSAGNIGYLIGNIKAAGEVKIGDTITHAKHPCTAPVYGFSHVKPVLFASIYPTNADAYEELRVTLDKLQLNDASLVKEPETSVALGFGFRCGFLGMLHMDITRERLTREFGLDVIATTPSVQLRAIDKQGRVRLVDKPSDMPPANSLVRLEEPIMGVKIISRTDFLGGIIQLCVSRRGVLRNQAFLGRDQVELTFDLPFIEILIDFFDKLKSISKGYASVDYTLNKFTPADLVKLDILINGVQVDAFSVLVHRKNAFSWGKKRCEELKKVLPRQLFEVPIQAAIGAKIIARTVVKAMRKNVTARCSGGDVMRKRKLLENQRSGKTRMRQIGKVQIPREAFWHLLKRF